MNFPAILQESQMLSKPGIYLRNQQEIYIESISSPYYFACREAYVPGCSCCFPKNNGKFVKSYRKRENLLQIFKDPKIHVSKMKEPKTLSSLKKKYVCPKCGTQCVRMGSDDSFLQCRHLVGMTEYNSRKITLDFWVVEQSGHELEKLHEGDCIDAMGVFYDLLEFKSIDQRIVGIPFKKMLILDFEKHYNRSLNISELLGKAEQYAKSGKSSRSIKKPNIPFQIVTKKDFTNLFSSKQVVTELDTIFNLVDGLFKPILPIKGYLLPKLVMTLGIINTAVRDIAHCVWDKQKLTEPENRCKSLTQFCLTQYPAEKTTDKMEDNTAGSKCLFNLNLFMVCEDTGIMCKIAKCVAKSMKGFIWLESVYDANTVKEYVKAGKCNIIFISDYLALNSKQQQLLEEIMRSSTMISIWAVCEKNEYERILPISDGLRQASASLSNKKGAGQFAKSLSLFDLVIDTTSDFNKNTTYTVDSLFNIAINKPNELYFLNPIKKYGMDPPVINSIPADKIIETYYLARRKVRRTTQDDLSSLAKFAYIFHFFKSLYLYQSSEIMDSVSSLDSRLWDPTDITMAIFLFEESHSNRYGPATCMISRDILHNGIFHCNFI